MTTTQSGQETSRLVRAFSMQRLLRSGSSPGASRRSRAPGNGFAVFGRNQIVPDALTTTGNAPLLGVFRFAQKPIELFVAPAGIVWFQLNPGATVSVAVLPANVPFQLV